MWTRSFWKATTERSIKTFAQAWAAVLIANGTGLLDTEWASGLSIAGMAALLSVLTSVGSAGVGPTGPSLVNEALYEQV